VAVVTRKQIARATLKRGDCFAGKTIKKHILKEYANYRTLIIHYTLRIQPEKSKRYN